MKKQSKSISEVLNFIFEQAERKTQRKNKIEQNELNYNTDDLDPVMSKDTLEYHYGNLAKGYFERFNNHEGDSSFNYGGAMLHNIFFDQFFEPEQNNKPSGESKKIIDEFYGSFKTFQNEFKEKAMSIQGSGWIYMDNDGDISIINNHEYKDNMKIVLLIDWWEHAWALDYQHEKDKYLENIWFIIDWNIINKRIKDYKHSEQED